MSGSSAQSTYPSWQVRDYIIASEGSSIAYILYGVYFAISGVNIALLRNLEKRYKPLLFYSIFQLVVTTLYFAVSLYAAPTQGLGIFGINGCHGPSILSLWPSIVVNVAFVLNTLASDAFLLYRCYVVCMANMYALAGPALLYLLVVGSSIAQLVVSSTSGATYSTHAVQVTTISFWSCSAAMNVCASSLISAQLWLHRQSVRKVGVPSGGFYLIYISMTLESALLYTAFAVITLVLFALNSPLENMFFPVLGIVQVIAPSLIIHRIARGISFQKDEYGTITLGMMRFACSDQPDSAIQHVTSGSVTNQDDPSSFIQEDEVQNKV